MRLLNCPDFHHPLPDLAHAHMDPMMSMTLSMNVVYLPMDAALDTYLNPMDMTQEPILEVA